MIVANDPMEFLRSLGSVEQLYEAGAQGVAPANRPHINTHIHLPPNFSAFESVYHAVRLAAQQGVSVLGVGNYYDYRVYREFTQAAQYYGIFPLFGTEIITLDQGSQSRKVKINDPDNPGRIYICGKAMSTFWNPSARAQALLARIRKNDEVRISAMTEKMAQCFAAAQIRFGLDAQEIMQNVAQRHDCDQSLVVLQERHVAQAYQERLFELVPIAQRKKKLAVLFNRPPQTDLDNPVAVQNEIRSCLMKTGQSCYMPEEFVGLTDARELILELGGIDCYPILLDGAHPICPFETPIDTLIHNIQALGFHMVEVIPVRNNIDILTDYVTKLRAAGLTVVAGTEHNTPDLIPMEPRCKDNTEISENLKDIFWEGGCVAAAHQFLKAHDELGFVDIQGQPHPDYASANERIAAFKQLGAAVIQTYFEKVKK